MASLEELLYRGRQPQEGLPQPAPITPPMAPSPVQMQRQMGNQPPAGPIPPPPPSMPGSGLPEIGAHLEQRLGQTPGPAPTSPMQPAMQSLLQPYESAATGEATTFGDFTQDFKVADRIAQLQGLQVGQGVGNTSGLLGMAKSQIGVPYVFGAENPQGRAGGRGSAFDCSGFTKWLYAKRGVNLPHQALQQARVTGSNLNRKQLRPGDLLYYSYGRLGSAIDHVAVYMGGGKAIGAAPSSNGVGIAPVDWSAFVGGGRVGGRKR